MNFIYVLFVLSDNNNIDFKHVPAFELHASKTYGEVEV